MAYRIVAKSADALEAIMGDIKNWFQGTADYVAKMDSETRKFVDPATKKIVSKSIDVIHVKDPATRKETVIKFIPLLKPEEIKIEIGGDNEVPMKGKLKNMMKGRGVLKSYTKNTLRKMESKTMKKSELQQIIREEIDVVLNESIDITDALIVLAPAFAGLAGWALSDMISTYNTYSSINKSKGLYYPERNLFQRIKDWWQSKQDNRAINNIVNRIKDDPEVQLFLKQPKNARGWKKMLATKLEPAEQAFIKKIYRTHFDK